MAQVQVIQRGEKRTRLKRTPNFPVAGILKPFGLYPVLIHPVLPGETLNSFTMKWRTLSKPIKHPLVGSWQESWLVYIKLTDIDRELGNMFISDTFSTAGYTAGTDAARYFTKTGQIKWVFLCASRFHDAYFMDDGEVARSLDGVRQTKLAANSWYQNMIFRPADDPLGTADVLDASREMDAYMMMQQMNMSELSYEKYLEQYGVTSIRTAEGDPEILRYARSWTLPVNTVEPSTGVPSSAWVWNDQIKSDEPKMFTEPGFLVMFTSIRPKMYQKHLEWSFVGNMWGFSDWFPVYNLDDPTAGIREIASSDPVFHADHRTDVGDVNLLYDHRDILSHGEQFVNDFTNAPYVLPMSTGLKAQDLSDNAELRGEYALSADIDGLFSSAAAVDKFCFYEGIGHMDISGHITDHTPRGR